MRLLVTDPGYGGVFTRPPYPGGVDHKEPSSGVPHAASVDPVLARGAPWEVGGRTPRHLPRASALEGNLVESRAGPSRAGSTGLLTPPPSWGGRGRGKVEPEADGPHVRPCRNPQPKRIPSELVTSYGSPLRHRVAPTVHG